MAVKYNRIILKVSGEALAGEKGTGFSDVTMRSICEGIRDAWTTGPRACILEVEIPTSAPRPNL